jgi:energy-coupling factor transporter ATP-binding protein EcfA2
MISYTKPLCVEFIGPWASGKTTLVNEVSSLLEQKGYKVLRYQDFAKRSRLERYVLPFLYGIIFSPKGFRCMVRLLVWYFRLRPLGKVERQIYLTLLKSYLARLFLIKKEKPDILLWEGEYHLLTIFQNMNKIRDEGLLSIMHSLSSYCEMAVVFMDVEQGTALKRAITDQARENKRFSDIQQKELQAHYGVIAQNQEKILILFRGSAVDIIRIDGDRTPRENAELLGKAIEKLLPQEKKNIL